MAKVNIFKFIRSSIIILIIIFFSVKFSLGLIFRDKLTYEVTYDQINIENNYNSIIFRNETIVKSNVSGNIKYFATEGEKIKKNQKIAEIYFSEGVSDSESSTVEDVTDFAPSEIIGVSIDEINEEISDILELSVESIKSSDYEKAAELKEDLILKMAKRDKLAANKSLTNSKSSFSEEFVGGNMLQEGESIILYSPSSGIVTFNIDNFEEKFTIEEIYEIDYSNILSQSIGISSISNNAIYKGNPVYKLIEPSTWFLVSIIGKDEINQYEKNKKISVEINGSKINGTIADSFESNGTGALVIKLNEQFPDFYKLRTVNAKILRENYQGLKVRKSSIMTKELQNGVYVLGADNVATYVPINVIGYNDEYAIVSDGYFYKDVDGEKVRVKTLEKFDEVIIDSSKFDEGDKVY